MNVSQESLDRFWSKVDKRGPDECWLWTGSVTPNGYGRPFVGTEMVQAHRFTYELLVGPIPKGLVIDHLCRNPPCVNPAHMEPVTQRENTLRGTSHVAVNAVKTHCIHGHEFTPENTFVGMYQGKRYRDCRACGRAKARRKSARRALRTRVTAGEPTFVCDRWLGDRYCGVPMHPIDGRHEDHAVAAGEQTDEPGEQP